MLVTGNRIGIQSGLTGDKDRTFRCHVVQVDIGRVADDGRVSGHSVGSQMGHFLGHLVGIISRCEIGREALVSLVKVQRHEGNQDDDASETVTA